jgi:hypothetical protein
MPSKYRRIAVVEDPELADAMRRSERLLDCQSSAALVREMALRGAASLEEERRISPGLKRILEIPGVRPARSSLLNYLEENPPERLPEDLGTNAVSRALEQQREDRV